MNFPGKVIIKIISILFVRQGPEFIFVLINGHKYWNIIEWCILENGRIKSLLFSKLNVSGCLCKWFAIGKFSTVYVCSHSEQIF